MASKAQPCLGVDWHLPARRGPGYAKRRFATTTQASADLIELLAADGFTWTEMAGEIRFDDEAKAVAEAFIEAGHGDTKASEHLFSPAGCASRLPPDTGRP